MASKKIPPVHPGEFIAEILAEYALSREAFARMIEKAGLSRVKVRNLTGGIAAMHSAWRI